MTTLWPIKSSAAEAGLTQLAILITERSENTGELGKKIEEMVRFVVKQGLAPRGMMFRLHAWKSVCVQIGALPPDLEVRFDWVEECLKTITEEQSK